MRLKYLIPIALSELYLISTLILFQFGPIYYYVGDPVIFWLLIALYHIGMVLGYLVGVVTRPRVSFSNDGKGAGYSSTYIWLFILVSIIAGVISYKNFTMSEGFLPRNLFSDIYAGVFSPNVQYYNKFNGGLGDGYSNSKLLNIFYFFIAPAKVLAVPVMVAFWHKLGLVARVSIFFASLYPALAGVVTGTNKPVFDFAILFCSSLFVFFVYRYYLTGFLNLRERGLFVVFFVLAIVGSISFFGSALQSRVSNIYYLEQTSPLGHLKIRGAQGAVSQDAGVVKGTWVFLTSYITQGYYGLSLAIEQDFSSTLGFGSSKFLERQLSTVMGIDLSENTYQAKVDSSWSKDAQWHSLYSYLANDVHFLGVVVFIGLFGFLFARVWCSVLDHKSLFGFLLIPLFFMVVLFVPANNQVFDYLDTFSSFLFVMVLWTFLGSRHSMP